MLEPLLLQVISLGFALLFVTAALHKFGDKPEFLRILEAYQILPRRMLPVIGKFVPMLEISLGIAWLAVGLFSLQVELVSIISTMLLTAYTLAIGINLMRGRRYIDCGCGFSSLAGFGGKALSSAGIQQLSRGLLWRNGLLIVTSLLAAIPPAERELVLVDRLSLVAALVAVILLYGAFNQLLANNNAIGAWRNSTPADGSGGGSHG